VGLFKPTPSTDHHHLPWLKATYTTFILNLIILSRSILIFLYAKGEFWQWDKNKAAGRIGIKPLA
jgi:hypothetical protein